MNVYKYQKLWVWPLLNIYTKHKISMIRVQTLQYSLEYEYYDYDFKISMNVYNCRKLWVWPLLNIYTKHKISMIRVQTLQYSLEYE